MKRFKNSLFVTGFLSVFSLSLFGQAGTISFHQNCNAGFTQTWAIDINEYKAVRFTYSINIVYGQDYIGFLETTGGSTSLVYTGYKTGTACTGAKNGIAYVVFTAGTAGVKNFDIQYSADNPLTTNSDLIVGGNGSIGGSLFVSSNITISSKITASTFSTTSTGSVMGNLGVGIAAPLTKLHVLNSTSLGSTAGNYTALTRAENNVSNKFMVNDFIFRESTGSDWTTASYLKGVSVDASFLLPGTLRSWIKQNPYAEKIDFGSSGTTYMSVGNNVGIGTTATPQYKLQVAGEVASIGVNAGFRVNSTSGDNINQAPWYGLGKSNLLLNSQPTGAVQLAGYYGLNFQTSQGQMVILDNGSVGIGINNPDPIYLLDVNGAIHTTGIVVEAAGTADYVFNKDYKLLKLSDIEHYIQDKGHLPEIPSNSEVKGKGINLVDMQNKLLQKIEELTLYVIQLQKEVEVLKEKK